MRVLLSSFRKIYKSATFVMVLSFLFGVALFSVLLAPTKIHASGATLFWFSIITKGLPAGLFLTMLSRLRIKNYARTLGIQQQQLPLLKKAIQTGVLPKDKKLRDALPGYMYTQYSWTKPRAKQFAAFLAVILGLNLLSDFGQRNILKLAIDIAVVITLVTFYKSIQKKAPTITRFYQQLGVDPETAKPVRSKLHIKMLVANGTALASTAKALLTLVTAIIGTAIFAVAVGAGITAPWIILPIAVPLGLVGLLYLVPYFSLKGRWALGYCIILAAATISAIHQLHMPLGHSHHVGAQTPLPSNAHSVAAYTIWTVLHSSIALIITSSLILLSIAFAKKQTREAEKELWMIFATVGVALTLFSFGISWPKASHPADRTSEAAPAIRMPQPKPDQSDTSQSTIPVTNWNPSLSSGEPDIPTLPGTLTGVTQD